MKLQALKALSSAHRVLPRRVNVNAAYPPRVLKLALLINPGEMRTNHAESLMTYRAMSDITSSPLSLK